MPGLVLRVVRGAGRGRDIAVADELVIGREAQGDGRLDGEPALSRRHARVVRGADGGLTVEDLGSLNGTHVNGSRIAGATRLRAGDELRLGETVLVVADPADPAAPRAGAGATVIADVPGAPARRVRPRSPDLRSLTGHPYARHVAGGVLALAVLVVVVLMRGGDDPADLAADGRRYTVQLIVSPSPVVRGLAAAAPATAPPRSGSAIVVDARRGLVLTADRLVAGAERISGRFAGGRVRRAALLARAPCDGVALVRLPGLPEAARAGAIGSAGGLGRGDRIVALGYPGVLVGRGGVRGGKLRAAEGAVAGLRRRARLDPADPRLSGLVVHTARIGPGGAGGPLVDDDGAIVGIDLVAPRGTRLRAALAAERAQGLYGDLATARTGADAGWRLEPWSQIRGRPTRGVLVTGVDAGGPASRPVVARALRARARRPSSPLLGATVFAVNGRLVDDAADVCAALRGVPRGRRVSVRADITTATLAGARVRAASRARAVRLTIRL